MNKFNLVFLICILILNNIIAQPKEDWLKISDNDKLIFIDKLNIVKLDNEINVWVFEQYKKPIDLEEVEKEKTAGNIIKEIYRNDPNVNIRNEIYQKSWEQIKKHLFLGIGWGNIGFILGKNQQGTTLNSSNIFLEVWLGAGIIGLLIFAVSWFYPLIKAIKRFFSTEDLLFQTCLIFIILSWLALTIPNLFNSGIMLGFFWLFWGVSFIFINLRKSEV